MTKGRGIVGGGPANRVCALGGEEAHAVRKTIRTSANAFSLKADLLGISEYRLTELEFSGASRVDTS